MQPIPRHWSRVEARVEKPGRGPVPVPLWGWSAVSLADAAAVARGRAAELTRRGLPGGRSPAEYYPARPVREEILEELPRDGAQEDRHADDLLAVLTRNRYGATVLSTDALLIADVDVPLAERRRPGLLGRLLGRGKGADGPDPAGDPADPAGDPAAPPALLAEADAAARSRIDAVLGASGDLGIHVHRTFGGYRVLVSGSGLLPEDPAAIALLEELGSDPLYVRLCRAQRSFRARLSPKPWRVGIRALGGSWPEGPSDRPAPSRRRRQWVERYSAATTGHAVCRRMSWNGVEPSTAEERRVLALHDRLTGADSGLPLA